MKITCLSPVEQRLVLVLSAKPEIYVVEGLKSKHSFYLELRLMNRLAQSNFFVSDFNFFNGHCAVPLSQN